MSQVQELQVAVTRLRRYTARVADKIDTGQRKDLIAALPDVAEVAEIARRLYTRIRFFVNSPSEERVGRRVRIRQS